MVLLAAACSGDHYEGGGRRKEVPQGNMPAAAAPGVSPGEGMSSSGGSLANEGDSGATSDDAGTAGGGSN